MELRLRRQETNHGEWSVLDPIRGYWICRYNHKQHKGTHVHHPENGAPVGAVDIATPQEAETVMGRYHERHQTFDLVRLQEVVKQWRSGSVGA